MVDNEVGVIRLGLFLLGLHISLNHLSALWVPFPVSNLSAVLAMGRCRTSVHVPARCSSSWTRMPLAPWVAPTLTNKSAASLPTWKHNSLMPLLGRDELTLLLDACRQLSSSSTFDNGLVCLWRWVLALFFFVVRDDWPRIFWFLLLMLHVLLGIDLLWVDPLTRSS